MKIKIRIVYPSGTSWNCIGSVYDEFIEDDRYHVCVLTENFPKYIDAMKKKKIKYIPLDEYDLKIDRPDVLLMTSYSSTPQELNFKGSRQYVNRVISLFPNIVINEDSLDLHWKYVNTAYQYLTPDIFLFDSLPYKFSKGYIDEKKAVKMGNPQFDELYQKMNMETKDSWEKLNGKKVFLWATDHGVQEYYPIEAFSVDRYINFFFNYFTKHNDIGLIVRFHPYLLRELMNDGVFWSYSDYEKVKDFCKHSNNIVWDDSPDFCSAYKRSDAMFVDVNCGLTVSYLCTGKPICRLVRNDMQTKLIHPELKDAYYYANDIKQCIDFINMVEEDCFDPKREVRAKVFTESVLHYDGCNGVRIKEYIDGLCML